MFDKDMSRDSGKDISGRKDHRRKKERDNTPDLEGEETYNGEVMNGEMASHDSGFFASGQGSALEARKQETEEEKKKPTTRRKLETENVSEDKSLTQGCQNGDQSARPSTSGVGGTPGDRAVNGMRVPSMRPSTNGVGTSTPRGPINDQKMPSLDSELRKGARKKEKVERKEQKKEFKTHRYDQNRDLSRKRGCSGVGGTPGDKAVNGMSSMATLSGHIKTIIQTECLSVMKDVLTTALEKVETLQSKPAKRTIEYEQVSPLETPKKKRELSPGSSVEAPIVDTTVQRSGSAVGQYPAVPHPGTSGNHHPVDGNLFVQTEQSVHVTHQYSSIVPVENCVFFEPAHVPEGSRSVTSVTSSQWKQQWMTINNDNHSVVSGVSTQWRQHRTTDDDTDSDNSGTISPRSEMNSFFERHVVSGVSTQWRQHRTTDDDTDSDNSGTISPRSEMNSFFERQDLSNADEEQPKDVVVEDPSCNLLECSINGRSPRKTRKGSKSSELYELSAVKVNLVSTKSYVGSPSDRRPHGDVASQSRSQPPPNVNQRLLIRPSRLSLPATPPRTDSGAGARNCRCPHCGSVWTTELELEEHYFEHLLGNRSCAVGGCEYTCSSRNELRRHIRAAHLRKHTCRRCGKAYLMASTLERHLRQCLPCRQCPLCPSACAHDATLCDHVASAHGAGQIASNRRSELRYYVCRECRFATTSRTVALDHCQCHILGDINLNITLCEICDLLFVTGDLHFLMHAVDDTLNRKSFQLVDFDWRVSLNARRQLETSLKKIQPTKAIKASIDEETSTARSNVEENIIETNDIVAPQTETQLKSQEIYSDDSLQEKSNSDFNHNESDVTDKLIETNLFQIGERVNKMQDLMQKYLAQRGTVTINKSPNTSQQDDNILEASNIKQPDQRDTLVKGPLEQPATVEISQSNDNGDQTKPDLSEKPHALKAALEKTQDHEARAEPTAIAGSQTEATNANEQTSGEENKTVASPTEETITNVTVEKAKDLTSNAAVTTAKTYTKEVAVGNAHGQTMNANETEKTENLVVTAKATDPKQVSSEKPLELKAGLEETQDHEARAEPIAISGIQTETNANEQTSGEENNTVASPTEETNTKDDTIENAKDLTSNAVETTEETYTDETENLVVTAEATDPKPDLSEKPHALKAALEKTLDHEATAISGSQTEATKANEQTSGEETKTVASPTEETNTKDVTIEKAKDLSINAAVTTEETYTKEVAVGNPHGQTMNANETENLVVTAKATDPKQVLSEKPLALKAALEETQDHEARAEPTAISGIQTETNANEQTSGEENNTVASPTEETNTKDDTIENAKDLTSNAAETTEETYTDETENLVVTAEATGPKPDLSEKPHALKAALEETQDHEARAEPTAIAGSQTEATKANEQTSGEENNTVASPTEETNTKDDTIENAQDITSNAAETTEKTYTDETENLVVTAEATGPKPDLSEKPHALKAALEKTQDHEATAISGSQTEATKANEQTSGEENNTVASPTEETNTKDVTIEKAKDLSINAAVTTAKTYTKEVAVGNAHGQTINANETENLVVTAKATDPKQVLSEKPLALKAALEETQDHEPTAISGIQTETNANEQTSGEENNTVASPTEETNTKDDTIENAKDLTSNAAETTEETYTDETENLVVTAEATGPKPDLSEKPHALKAALEKTQDHEATAISGSQTEATKANEQTSGEENKTVACPTEETNTKDDTIENAKDFTSNAVETTEKTYTDETENLVVTAEATGPKPDLSEKPHALKAALEETQDHEARAEPTAISGIQTETNANEQSSGEENKTVASPTEETNTKDDTIENAKDLTSNAAETTEKTYTDETENLVVTAEATGPKPDLSEKPHALKAALEKTQDHEATAISGSQTEATKANEQTSGEENKTVASPTEETITNVTVEKAKDLTSNAAVTTAKTYTKEVAVGNAHGQTINANETENLVVTAKATDPKQVLSEKPLALKAALEETQDHEARAEPTAISGIQTETNANEQTSSEENNTVASPTEETNTKDDTIENAKDLTSNAAETTEKTYTDEIENLVVTAEATGPKPDLSEKPHALKAALEKTQDHEATAISGSQTEATNANEQTSGEENNTVASPTEETNTKDDTIENAKDLTSNAVETTEETYTDETENLVVTAEATDPKPDLSEKPHALKAALEKTQVHEARDELTAISESQTEATNANEQTSGEENKTVASPTEETITNVTVEKAKDLTRNAAVTTAKTYTKEVAVGNAHGQTINANETENLVVTAKATDPKQVLSEKPLELKAALEETQDHEARAEPIAISGIQTETNSNEQTSGEENKTVASPTEETNTKDVTVEKAKDITSNANQKNPAAKVIEEIIEETYKEEVFFKIIPAQKNVEETENFVVTAEETDTKQVLTENSPDETTAEETTNSKGTIHENAIKKAKASDHTRPEETTSPGIPAEKFNSEEISEEVQHQINNEETKNSSCTKKPDSDKIFKKGQQSQNQNRKHQTNSLAKTTKETDVKSHSQITLNLVEDSKQHEKNETDAKDETFSKTAATTSKNGQQAKRGRGRGYNDKKRNNKNTRKGK